MSSILQFRNAVFQYLPPIAKRLIKDFAEKRKAAYWKECFKVKVSKEQVDELFVQLALDTDVMIHSSLPEIGDIKLRHITDNLKKYVLDKGKTILCPAIPIKGSSLDYLMSIKEFDVRTAPNAMGAISRFYGRQNGSRRSLSPTHSVIALGDQSVYYTKDHHLSETPFTETSPYFKLILNGGKILMFGASLSHVTFCHVLEDMIGENDYPVEVYDSRRFEVRLLNEDGVMVNGTFRAHSHKNGRMRDSSEIMRIVRSLPTTRTIPIGCGEVILLDARDVILCLLSQLKLGITTSGRRKVSDACKFRADEWIRRISQL